MIVSVDASFSGVMAKELFFHGKSTGNMKSPIHCQYPFRVLGFQTPFITLCTTKTANSEVEKLICLFQRYPCQSCTMDNVVFETPCSLFHQRTGRFSLKR